jgi:hypothetical protein
MRRNNDTPGRASPGSFFDIQMKKILARCSILCLVSSGIWTIQVFVSCSPVSPFEETYDVAVYALISEYSVPDSSTQNNILLHLKGSIGNSTAYRFDRIGISRTDSLFRVGVIGRETYKSGAVYQPRDNTFDTTIVLSTPRKGWHFIDILADQGTLHDSTLVF